ncbi:tripartite tricarboxylate transporter substrate binding protein [Nitrincola alkalisediminis]|uniref:tripartite tricarboxylate transporter substrate binding protein n=1 Tax=Nitrincola alkalisediminis TaxID=1366656 RepID=UPI001873EEA2|nr:tripartite tricarboxylate transporter substrate binding protein [Nitrincola alkalisediminis]
MKKTIMTSFVALALSASAWADFPTKDIQGIIQWGAGGSTDTVMRSVTPHVEKELGKSIVLSNRTGGVGVIAMRYVESRRADGYTLLMGAENPQMYKVLGLADVDYNDMVPINLLARGIPMFVANNDAPYNTMSEMVEYAKANPGSVKVGSTGTGGLTSIVLAMLESQVSIELTNIPYDGDGPALTALQGGAIDIMPAVLGAAIEHVRAGRMKVIGLVDTASHPVLPGVAPITDEFPGFKDYLPWGPFFGVFVKKGTPDAAVDTLVNAFNKGAQHPEFVELMENRGFIIMNASGKEAEDFLSSYRSVSSWVVHEAGFSKHSPEEYGIPKP